MREELEIRYYKPEELRVEAADGCKRISGMAVPYGSPSEDLGGFREVIEPGAFADSLAGGNDIVADVEHSKMDRKLAKRSRGTLELRDTQPGLYATISLPATSVGRDTEEEVRGGLLDGMSIGMKVLKDSFAGKAGEVVRHVHKAILRSVSLTGFPAYPQTAGTVALRSLEAYRTAAELEDGSVPMAVEEAEQRALANEHAARMHDPADFDPDTFRRKELAPGVTAIMAKKKEGEGGMMIQSMRFSADKFTPEEAKKWLKAHDMPRPMMFEPAAPEKRSTEEADAAAKAAEEARVAAEAQAAEEAARVEIAAFRSRIDLEEALL